MAELTLAASLDHDNFVIQCPQCCRHMANDRRIRSIRGFRPASCAIGGAAPRGCAMRREEAGGGLGSLPVPGVTLLVAFAAGGGGAGLLRLPLLLGGAPGRG